MQYVTQSYFLTKGKTQGLTNARQIGKDSEVMIKETLGHLKTPEVKTGLEISEDLPFHIHLFPNLFDFCIHYIVK